MGNLGGWLGPGQAGGILLPIFTAFRPTDLSSLAFTIPRDFNPLINILSPSVPQKLAPNKPQLVPKGPRLALHPKRRGNMTLKRHSLCPTPGIATTQCQVRCACITSPQDTPPRSSYLSACVRGPCITSVFPTSIHIPHSGGICISTGTMGSYNG